MSRKDLTYRLRWIALNAVLFLGMGWIAYSLEGWQAALPFVLPFALGSAYVLLRKPSEEHP
jgi:hypothetical protein